MLRPSRYDGRGFSVQDEAGVVSGGSSRSRADARGGKQPSQPTVSHFRQFVVWPLQLVSGDGQCSEHGCHEIMDRLVSGHNWHAQEDKFGGESDLFVERHYREFISFLPHVQRFLYGDARVGDEPPSPGDICMRVYWRTDIQSVRVVLHPGDAPVTCRVVHVHLFFFYDVDAVILVCELAADEIPLDSAQKMMQRFGRAYPAGWSENGDPVHCPSLVEWLDAEGKVIAASDYHDRERFMRFVDERRSTCIARHWEFLLSPLVNDASGGAGRLRIREIEYYRMPVMTFLMLEDLSVLRKADYISLALATAPAPRDRDTLPFSERFLNDFEGKHAYERLYAGGLDAPGIETRFLTCGEAFTIVSSGSSGSLKDPDRGLLSQFRHQYFLLFLIAHFHRSALLMLADRMVGAIKKLDPRRSSSLNAFRDETFALQENFLRFSQRYLFTEISGRTHIRDLFRMIREHLCIDRLQQEVRSDITDMVHYLDSTTLRKQSGSMHRLTVVTVMGLTGSFATGFLGMNLLSAAEEPLSVKALYFGTIAAMAAVLTALAVVFSSPLSRLLERIAGENRKV